MPLTADRAKPAVPFGGSYRLVDFVLSNLVNAGFARIAVLTQYKSHSLDRHITQTWAMPAILGDYVTAVPAQQRLGPRWYTGSADAIYQSLNLIEDEDPEYLLVFGADNIYRMDPRQMLDQHIDTGAAVTVAGIRKPRSEATEFGVIEQDESSTKITAFHEKPEDPPAVPGSPDESFISMGNYIFSRDWLVDTLRADAGDTGSVHDMGGNIIPALTAQGLAHVYDFGTNEIPGQSDRDRGYWKDVGLDRRLPRGAHGPGERPSGLQPVQPQMADHHLDASARRRRPSSSRAATPTSRSSAPARSSPVDTSARASCRRTCTSCRAPTWRARS